MELSGFDIIELRKKIDVSQEELAELIGVSLRTVQNYESGKKIPQSKYAILRKLINEGNANNPDINNSNSTNMEDQIAALRQMLQQRDDEIFNLRTEILRLKKGLGKQEESFGPGDRESRRNTG